MKKRIISLMLILVMAIGFVPTIAFAETKTTTDGFTYEIENGEVRILKYDGTATELIIPSEIEGYPVVYLGWSIGGERESAYGSMCYNHDIQSVVIPNSVQVIGNATFSNCVNLESITIPDSVTTIGIEAFVSCRSLKQITLSNNITNIDWHAFYNTAYYNDETNWENNCLYIGDCFLQAKETISGNYTIKEGTSIIAYGAFLDCTNLQEITIPDSVSKISEDMFEGCTSLTNINFGIKIESIGDGAFKGCTGLTEIVIPETVTSIGEYVFSGCKNLIKVTIPKSVEECGHSIFSMHEGGFMIPAYSACDNLKDIYYDGNRLEFHVGLGISVPSSVNEHYITKEYTYTVNSESYKFDCEVNENTGKVKIIGKGKFYFPSCLRNVITTVEIGEGISEIGAGAFSNFSSLSTLVLSNESLTAVGPFAFYRTSIENVYISDVASYCKVNYYKDEREPITSISSPFTNGTKLYVNNEQVTNLVIPSDVTKINAYAFSGLNTITSLTIPTNVKEIGEDAFANCTGITDIYYGGTRNEFAQIAIAEGNSRLALANIHYIDSHAHSYTNACDTTCNGCDFTREITHTYGAYVSDNNATTEKDGTKTRTCSVCGNKDTVTDVGSKIVIIDTSKIFTDIPTKKWFKESVDYSYTYGIFTGTSKTTFSPNENITRAQFVQVLANLEGVDTSNRNVATKFTDVPSGKWYTAAVKWASENGVVNGVGEGKFDPNANVTREQMCVMLVNYAKFKGITIKNVEAKASFADDASISKWAKTAVYTCQQADIVNGKGANTFDPKGTGTRAEASVIFTKFHKEYF